MFIVPIIGVTFLLKSDQIKKQFNYLDLDLSLS